jgi:hypothetical protein
MSRISNVVRQSSLSLFFLFLFLASVAGQAVAGWHQFNAQQAVDGLGVVSFGHYLLSADFAGDVTENWQSE